MSGATMLSQPRVDELGGVIETLAAWQVSGGPVQLHSGDLGWNWRFGAEATAAALWTWSRDGQVLAVGMLDSPTLLRLAVAPAVRSDEALAAEMVLDLSRPERGILPAGSASVEARFGGAFVRRLREDGWEDDEAWTPLERGLTGPVEPAGVRIEVVAPERADLRAAVQRAAFATSTFTGERWRVMATGPAYGDARCLLAYDSDGAAVATATVWSAGPGRPGLLEPMGVHRDHRGHGHGRAICRAAAATLRDLGASSAIVCTPSANAAAVATYRSAGFVPGPEVRDLRRPA
jgi:GNAT superfamily N-acetyltransferase